MSFLFPSIPGHAWLTLKVLVKLGLPKELGQQSTFRRIKLFMDRITSSFSFDQLNWNWRSEVTEIISAVVTVGTGDNRLDNIGGVINLQQFAK